MDASGSKPAEDLRGATCQATEATLKARLGADYQIASIGPAGENAVRYATISHDGRHAGRGGSGAVLGSKNIKAIALRGTQRCEWAHPRELTEYSKDLSKRSFGPATAKYRELGTATNLLTFNRLGALPTRNFQSGTFDGGGQHLARADPHHPHAGRAPAASPAPSGASTSTRSATRDGVRLEYESLFALGSLCGVSDPDAVLRASRLCDELGIDTISAGGTIAFAMECVERGWLDEPWLTFGSGDAMLRAIELDRPPRGPRRPAGRGQPPRGRGRSGTTASRSLRRSRVSRFPATSRRALQTMALGFAVGARGADHNRSGAYEVDFSDKVDRRHATLDAVRYAIETEDKAALMDSLIICKFLRGVFDGLLRRGRRHAPPGHRLGRDRRRTSRDGQAHRRHQAAIQSAGRLDAGRGHAAGAVSRHAAAERSRRRRSAASSSRPSWPSITASAAGKRCRSSSVRCSIGGKSS